MLPRMRRALAVLACVSLSVLVAAPAVAAGPLDPQVADKIRKFVTQQMDELHVPGMAVVVVTADGPIFAEGYGAPDDSGQAVTPQTPFRIASLSKQLTAIAVRQLIDDGRLELDALVADYLPWFGEDVPALGKVTVRHLLSHTSGWAEGLDGENLIDTSTDDGALERHVRDLARVEPAHALGEFFYDNSNYNVLSLLVATASGMTFEDYLQENVLTPLQMSHTHLTDAAARADGVAHGHYPFFGLVIPWELPFSRGSMGSASVVASAEDLGHVVIAHLNQGKFGDAQVLSPEAMADIETPLVHPAPWDGYGWGWWSHPLYDAGGIRDIEGAPLYQAPVYLEHGGSLANFAAGMLVMPEAGYGVVVLMNLNDESISSRYHQMDLGIAYILSGLSAPGLATYEDALSQNAKLIAAAVPLTQLAGVVFAAWRFRRWRRRRPDTSSTRWRLGNLLLPLVPDIGIPVYFWGLVLSRSEGSFDLGRTFTFTPDLGLALVAMTTLGFGWALLRTLLTLRLMRTSGLAGTAQASELATSTA
jgi:CubicO group peptidase (beta-lactamase class C family)